ncbi:MAG: excinuclease ABC subunit UvrC [Mogibacterium sp.]|nr:excinuclease ABC subunit UvrC [Mogibacterium sp.]
MFNIEEELKKLPQSPGVYLHKDHLGSVIYVGKAVNLRNRVRQYFQKTSQQNPKVRAMVSNIAEFEYINCATEMEALILECNLIKKYMPKYNILLKDDKTYPYIEVTTSEEYPRVIRTRTLARDENRYFGPYTDGTAVWRILKMIDELYPLKKCQNRKFPENVRPCLNYYIGKCKGVCIGAADREDYDRMVGEVLDILSGRDTKILKRLEQKMYEESELLHYEEAARYRDYMLSLKALGETQRAAMIKDHDIDILIPVFTQSNRIVLQYRMREGKMIGREINYLEDGGEATGEELLTAFLQQYYLMAGKLPKEILLPVRLKDAPLTAELLDHLNEENYKAGNDTAHKTRLIVPERGAKKALLDMAAADSIELTKSLDERAERELERKNELRDRITALIREACAVDGAVPYTIEEGDDREYRVEAYDISNMNGLDSVGAMVVYEGRRPVRNDYRKFRIRTAASGDDYGSLQEVLYRRLKRARDGDEGFSTYPDIFFIDGGLGQVHAVKMVVDAFRMSIPVVGLAKDDAHRTRAIVFSDGHEIDLKSDPLLFSYAGNIQEEVHRFAITFHRGTRGKKMTKSALEEIPGIGPKRRKELLQHFRSIEAIRNASYEELLEVSGMTASAAESVLQYFAERADNP